MASYQALGTGPVSFVDGNQNQQEIPLSAISFGASGPDASAWPLYAANKDVIKALLAQMVLEGLLAPGTQASPPLALTATAAQAGANGNSIAVTFSDPSQKDGTVTVEVAATEVYPGLTTGNVGAAVGTSAATATGLVFLSAAGTGNMPVATTGKIVGTATLDIPDAAAKASFTLGGTSADFTVNVTVSLDPSGTTFTLTVTGNGKATGLKLTDLETAASNPFAFLVTFSGASGGPLPAASTITLQGGEPAVSTTATTATAKAYSS